MATPARKVQLVFQPAMSPVKTPTVVGSITAEDIAANVVIIADDSTQRLQLGQAIAASVAGKRTVVILTTNDSFGNLNVGRGKNIIQDVATDQVNGTFQLLDEDGETLAQKIADGESFKIDIATLSQEKLSTFLNFLGRELNRLNVCDVLFVLDMGELFLPRKRNGYDTSGIADFHQLLVTARARGNNFISMVESADDMIIEVRNKTKTFIVGRLGAEAHIRSLNGAIGDDRLFRNRNEALFNIGVRTMPNNSFWLFNMATSNTRPGMPFYIDPAFFSGQVPGNPTRRGKQSNLTAKKLVKDLKDARDIREQERKEEADRKSDERNRRRESTAKLTSRGRQRDMKRGNKLNGSQLAYALRQQHGFGREVHDRLKAKGVRIIWQKISIADHVLRKQKKTITADALVNFIVGNTALDMAAKMANARQAKLRNILTGKMLGAFYYQAIRLNKPAADRFINALCDMRNSNGAGLETRKMLANVTVLSNKTSTPKHLRVLNAGWNRHLAEEAANDNSAAKGAA